MLILTFFVAVVAATVYNSMHLQSTVGVGDWWFSSKHCNFAMEWKTKGWYKKGKM